MRQPKPSQPTDQLAGLLLEIKDELDEAKQERRTLQQAFNRFNHADPGHAAALAREAQESAHKARQSLESRREDLETRNARLRLLTALSSAAGTIFLVALCLWVWLTYAAALPWLCELGGATHGLTEDGVGYCVAWGAG